MKPVNWGILSTANIGVGQVIPAMQQSDRVHVSAICSRNIANARSVAEKLNIAKAYGSYEELLADPEIEAIYNPLPNHLHVPWTLKALAAGKHVLCEKPFAFKSADLNEVVEAADQAGRLVQEAFMVRTAPQWQRVMELIHQGTIGELRAIQGAFSYFNDDPGNIRNQADIGGGAIYDIGVYPIITSRMVTDAEPIKLVANLERDPAMQVDRLSSVMMQFPGNVQANFICSTQMVPYQRMQIFGTKGRIEVEIPFNAPNQKPCRIFIDDGSDKSGAGVKIEEIPTSDQYTIQGELFSRAIRGEIPQPMPLSESIANMKVLDAIFTSEKSGGWAEV